MNEAYVLHSLAWRETSLIVEVLTRAEGRLGLVARGARRPRSALRGLLQPFQPIMVRYASKGDLRTLMAAEWQGGMPVLSGEALLAGFYLNELIMRLLPRQDAHPVLFDAYRSALFGLASLSRGEFSLIEPILRQFECRLLREMGVLPSFDAVSDQGPESGLDGQPISEPLVRALARFDDPLDVFAPSLADPGVASQAKRLLRSLLRHHLGGAELMSRETIRDLHRLRETVR